MIQSILLSMVVLGQVVLTGSTISVREAQEKARLIVVAKPIGGGDILGAGVVQSTVLSLRNPKVLKGEVKVKLLRDASVMAGAPESLPKDTEDYIFFINDFSGHLNIVKILPMNEENMAAVRKEIKAREKR